MGNDLLLPPVAATQKWVFGFGDRIGINVGTPRETFFRFVETRGTNHTFENLASGVFESFTDAEITSWSKTKGRRYDPGWHTRREVEARRLAGVDNIALLPKKDRTEIIRRLKWVSAVENYCEDCKLPLTNATLKRVIAEKSDETLAEIKAERTKLRVGKTVGAEAVPHERTLWRWLSAFNAGGRKEGALRPGYFKRPKTGASLWHADVEELIRKKIAFYMSETRPSQDEAYLAFKGEVAALNARRKEVGEGELDYPSDKTFGKRIRAHSAFAIHAGRHGIDAAMKKFGYVTLGLDDNTFGQRIEMDCWSIQLQTLLIQAHIWDALTEELQKKVARQRYTLCMAIDAASRCCVGMCLGKTENTDLAIATVNMVVRDKQPYADAVGALTPWPMRCGLLNVATDMGSPFISDEFRAVVAALGGNIVNPAAGQAQMRARIERIFSTLNKRLLGHLTGRTFSNTKELGDYKAEARASITEDQLCWLLVRFVVDVYHNSPHEGLRLETPYSAYHRLIQANGVRPLPDSELLRNVFGLRLTRTITPKGVRVMNLYYQSPALHEFLKQHGHGKEVEVILDVANLGAITVKLDGDAHAAVPCIKDEFDGVCAEDWIATCANLRARFAEQAKIAENIVFQTLREIQELSDAAVKRANLGSTTVARHKIESAERKLMIAWTSKLEGDDNPDIGGDIFAAALPGLPAIDQPEAKWAETPVTPAPTDSTDDQLDRLDETWGFED